MRYNANYPRVVGDLILMVSQVSEIYPFACNAFLGHSLVSFYILSKFQTICVILRRSESTLSILQ